MQSEFLPGTLHLLILRSLLAGPLHGYAIAKRIKDVSKSALAVEEGKWHYLGFASFLMVLWYLGTALLLMIIFHYLFSRTFRDAANIVKKESLKSLGFGFLFLVGVPVLD